MNVSTRLLIVGACQATLVGGMWLAPNSRPAQAISFARPPSTGTLNPFSPRGITLKDRLEKGLKARRPSEFAFVSRVVALVERNELPLKLVDGTFLWARRKPWHKFQYFRRALVVRAARIGIRL